MSAVVTRSVLDRLLTRIAVDPSTGCWEWQGAISSGYGRIWADGKLAYTHRVAHELLVGPIPPGFDIDHLCRNRSCCNPAHLEAVTRSTNLLRGETLTRAHRDDVNCGFDGCKNCARFRRAS